MAKITPIPVLYKKDFEKLPEWDFEDVYLHSSRPKETACPESLRRSKDEEFQKAFIPNIQLFLHKDHMNITEWNRLAHFNNPFGFMEYNYDEIKRAVDLIPKPESSQLLPVPSNDSEGCISCAVVGTGGILYGSKKGKEIDSHDYVFRLNGAVIEGFEEDVGNKTSVYVHTAYSLTQAPMTLKKFGFKGIPRDEGIKYVMIPEGLRDYQFLQGLLQGKEVTDGPFMNSRPWIYYRGQFDKRRFYVLHPDFLRYIRKRFLPSKQLRNKSWVYYRPTNGAFTVFLALHTCDVVDIYGFMTEDYDKYSNYYYEKLAKTKVIFYINHDYKLEMKTWQKLHNSKIIRLYQRAENTENRTTKSSAKHQQQT
ncbi:alpha-N-acetylgalactosaminide alpha-2,6-sialyltransferase 1 [Chanos chanos]|uniref:alpha-N-acetylgalactosaminide alpha-2,6-sialyltransferase n=1 Tax=Chanos chanos TaxID=29144 RepID=A0A6J2VDT0_CHACN|nr:alpha-N-acetylgalactosaminide alpha-2,6-sialyltransferase 1-like [Chanos chanos]